MSNGPGAHGFLPGVTGSYSSPARRPGSAASVRWRSPGVVTRSSASPGTRPHCRPLPPSIPPSRSSRDVTDAAERAALVKHMLATHGRVDVLVNNAGARSARLPRRAQRRLRRTGLRHEHRRRRRPEHGSRRPACAFAVPVTSSCSRRWRPGPRSHRRPCTRRASSRFTASSRVCAGSCGAAGCGCTRSIRLRSRRTTSPARRTGRRNPVTATAAGARVSSVVGRRRRARRSGRRAADHTLGAPGRRSGAARAGAADRRPAGRGVRPVRPGDHREGRRTRAGAATRGVPVR